MNDGSEDDLAKSLEDSLADRHGPILPSSILTKVLGYTSAAAFRQSLVRRTVPVPVFRIANRRGHFALTRDVARWLARQRQEAVAATQEKLQQSSM